MFGSGWCGGMGIGGWLLMIAFWGGFLALVLWAVTRLFPSGRPTSDAQALLDQRLAAGEVDPETYRQVSDELAGRRPSVREDAGRTRAGVT